MTKPPMPATTTALNGTPGPSEVDHVAGEAVEAFLQRLGHRRMGVHVAGQLVGGQIPFLRQRELHWHAH